MNLSSTQCGYGTHPYEADGGNKTHKGKKEKQIRGNQGVESPPYASTTALGGSGGRAHVGGGAGGGMAIRGRLFLRPILLE